LAGAHPRHDDPAGGFIVLSQGSIIAPFIYTPF
jgi:hypothetical protein